MSQENQNENLMNNNPKDRKKTELTERQNAFITKVKNEFPAIMDKFDLLAIQATDELGNKVVMKKTNSGEIKATFTATATL